jgi:predicted RNA-binding Zn-ribbon protein involved in translation (DUF1610 family)
MSNVDKNNGNQILNFNLIWLCIYLVVAVAIANIIPFPFSFYACLLVLVLVNMVRRKVGLRRTNESVLRAMYEWFTSLGDISKIDRTMRFWNTQVKFYCMNCGNQHEKIACPQCGSKAVRMS